MGSQEDSYGEESPVLMLGWSLCPCVEDLIEWWCWIKPCCRSLVKRLHPVLLVVGRAAPVKTSLAG